MNKTTVLNCPVDLVNLDNAINQINHALDLKKNFQIVTINPEMIMNAQKNPNFLNILKNSDLNLADGVGIKIALKMQGINQTQIRGIDFSRFLIDFASKNDLSVALLGSTQEVIEKTKEKILEKYPNLNLCYTKNGYFKDENEVIQELKEKNPQILLVGLGSPYQEELIYKLKNILTSTVMIGVGGSFDVFSGTKKESPVIFRKLGLEWLYRTLKEPKRFKRIFPTLPLFLIKCIIDSIKRRVGN